MNSHRNRAIDLVYNVLGSSFDARIGGAGEYIVDKLIEEGFIVDSNKFKLEFGFKHEWQTPQEEPAKVFPDRWSAYIYGTKTGLPGVVVIRAATGWEEA